MKKLAKLGGRVHYVSSNELIAIDIPPPSSVFIEIIYSRMAKNVHFAVLAVQSTADLKL